MYAEAGSILRKKAFHTFLGLFQSMGQKTEEKFDFVLVLSLFDSNQTAVLVMGANFSFLD